MSDPALGSLAGATLPQSVPAADRVADALRRQIVDGSLEAGVRLTEEVVSAHLGVSRNTVREAFLILASERLVERRANRGVFVAEPTLAMVRDLYAVRDLIEPAAVLWGSAPTLSDFERAAAIIARGRSAVAAGDYVAVRRANQEIHRWVVTLSRSERTIRWFEVCLAEMWLVFHAISDATFHVPYVERNAQLVDLLAAGRREDAAAHLRLYLADARADLVARLAEAGVTDA